jgi:hypothetical protein
MVVAAFAAGCFLLARALNPVYRRWFGDDALAVVLLYGPAKILGLTGCGLYALGLTRGLTAPEAQAFGLGFLCFGFAGVAGAVVGFGNDLRAPRGVDGWSAIAALALASMGAVTLLGALAPPTSNEWDVLAYHFAAPMKWLADGHIGPVPYDHHANFPMLTEMLYSIGFGSSGSHAGKLFHWAFAALTLATTWWAGRRWVSPRAGWLAAVLLASAPLFAWEATTAYIDIASTLYVTLSVVAFIRYLETRRPMWIPLSGLMAGFSLGTKYTMVATAGLLVLWAAWLAARKAGVSWKQAALLAGVVAVVGAPWFIKNIAWTGNPVYPFFYSWFDGRWWSRQAAEDYKAEQARFGIGKTVQAFVMAPWTTAFHSEYHANPPDVFDGSLSSAPARHAFPAVFGGLGIGVVGLLPLGLFARRRNRPVLCALGYSGAVFLTWFALTHQSRYLLTAMPLLCIGAAWAARETVEAGRAWKWPVALFALLAFAFGAVPLAAYVAPLREVALGRESPDAFLARTEPLYRLSQAANRIVPASGRILLLQETRGAWLKRPYMWGNPSQNALIPWADLRDVPAMNAELRRQGITHVIVNWGATSAGSARESWPALAAAAISDGSWRAVVPAGETRARGIVLYEVIR